MTPEWLKRVMLRLGWVHYTWSPDMMYSCRGANPTRFSGFAHIPGGDPENDADLDIVFAAIRIDPNDEEAWDAAEIVIEKWAYGDSE